MQNYISSIVFLFLTVSCFAQNNTIEINAEGIVFPRLSTAERNALTPQIGQCIFNTHSKALECFDGTGWNKDLLTDEDGDTGINFQEFGNNSPDLIEFYINTKLPMKLEKSLKGSSRLSLSDGQNNLLIGDHAGDAISGGTINTYIGYGAGAETNEGNANIAIGKNAGNNIRQGNDNITIGSEAGLNIKAGHDNIALGYRAGRDIYGASENVLIGSEAGMKSSTDASVMIGYRAGKENMGTSNTFLGHEAGTGDPNVVSDGYENVAIGYLSGRAISKGIQNTTIGTSAGAMISQGTNNVALGYFAGSELNDGKANVMIGANAGQRSQGVNNVFIGSSSGVNVTGENNIFLGTDNGLLEGVMSNQLLIGVGSSISDKLITGEFDKEIVTIQGDLHIRPKSTFVINNSHLRMADSSGNMDRVISRNASFFMVPGSVGIGNIDNSEGHLHLRAAGKTYMSLLADGMIKFWPMSGPPGVCDNSDTSRQGQVYFDSDDGTIKGCGLKNPGDLDSWGWWAFF